MVMDRKIAEFLIQELERHPPLNPTALSKDKDGLIGLLESTDVPDSRRFYEVIKPNQTPINGSIDDYYFILSLRRVLRNDQAAKDYHFLLKEIYGSLVSKLGFYDSNALIRNMRGEKEIAEMMQKSGEQYSLFGKLETFDEFSKKRSVRPIMVIPNSHNASKITAWEDANTSYFTTDRSGNVKRLTREKYFKPLSH